MGVPSNIPEAKKVEEVKPEPTVAKKPRAFVEESDIFDFSGMQPKSDNEDLKIAPLAMKKSHTMSSNNSSGKKPIENDGFANLF